MGSEYRTAEVVRDVQEYVEANGGQWPRSWEVIGDGTDHSEYTVVRFDLSAEEILEDKQLIFGAIRPTSGRYLTYPHAARDLGRLYEAILRAHEEQQR